MSFNEVQQRQSRRPDCNNPHGENFDIWNLIKRPLTADPYQLTARYRLKSAPARRVKSGIVSRRRRRPESVAESEGCESLLSTATTDGAFFFDFDKDLPDEFDFDADEDKSTGRQSTMGTHCQLMYLRSCKSLNIRPTSFIYKHLTLDKVELKHHNIGPEGAKACAVSLVENSSVQVLNLEDNGIGTAGAVYIADMLTENTFITELERLCPNHIPKWNFWFRHRQFQLSLAENDIKTEGAKAIIKAIKDMDSLTKLNLSGNGLQEYDGDLIADLIDQSHNLKELRVNHNSFRENGGIAIGDAIAWNDTLEVLDLSWNHLRRSGAQAIARGIAINSGITVLNIAWNGFYLDGCKELCKALERNKTLLDLDLSSNRINRQCLEELWKGLKKNSTLKTIKLADNPLTSFGAVFLLQQIAETKASGLVDLNLGSQCVERVFPDILDKIQEVRLFKCQYGAVIGQEGDDADDVEKGLVDENPVLILMEFGKILGLRLTDLFAMMDKDGSKTLTREEIKLGLSECNIPLSAKALDVLVEKLDQDGDGEIDYAELMSGHSQHRRRVTKNVMMSRAQNVDMEETEVGRIRKKLKTLLAKKKREQALSLSKKKLSAVTAIQGKPTPASTKSQPDTDS